MDKRLISLQNGSDIRGVAMVRIAGESVTLTPAIAAKIAGGFAQFVCGRVQKSLPDLTLAVGRDSRLTGPALSVSIMEALQGLGCTVLDFGLASTPAMFMSTLSESTKADGALMLTASHLPFNRNGLKFFMATGGLEKEEVSAVLANADKGGCSKTSLPGRRIPFDFMSVYSGLLREGICKGVQAADYLHPLKGLRIIVDAGNGAGGFYAEKVLRPLGADVSGSCFLEPDGRFPNHIPNPENQEAMDAAIKATLDAKADLGIIFDTDVDRAAVVDKNGKQINRNRLVALMASIVLREHAGSAIVTDSITSEGLTIFINDVLHGRHHRFKRGYRNVINEAIRLNTSGEEAWLAIETSGHAAMKENYFLDDGAYLVNKVVVELACLKREGSSLDSLLSGLREPAESVEFRLPILEPDFAAYGKKVIAGVERFCSESGGWSVVPENYEGTRISCDKENGFGWFLLRLSLHDPMLPLNVESDVRGGIQTIMKRLATMLAAFEKLDCNPLKEYL